ncbi:MAG: dephospho-CoA kinase, partial [Clostridia bacterium]|nr:dephospho-CoA kinase [Clostridia bacterium]
MKPFILGLTGGTGCGKSTAAHYFKKNGAHIIDADTISRSIMEPGQPAFKEVTAFFQDVLMPDGTLNRKKLASIVFHDEKQLNILNTITHRYIHDEIITIIKKSP